VAIKDPTSAVFLRQNGSNVLMVGHREEAAVGVLASCFVSLAAQNAPKHAKFYIFDGMRADAPEVGFWKRLAEVSPHEVKIVGVREAPAAMAEIAEELTARQEAGHDESTPIYILLYNLGRFRELRKEDDYGFSSSEGPPNPAKQFSTILREGPPHGVHTVIWCDTYSNVARMLDRQSFQDFEMRILFQMNANDSSSLMDSPEASRLGVHRAILYDEGQGITEKFRPYGLPTNEYLASVQKRLCGRKG
jgi:DNA segregation ATPase FtsK/SpoIIIE, S-DNA-T family